MSRIRASAIKTAAVETAHARRDWHFRRVQD